MRKIRNLKIKFEIFVLFLMFSFVTFNPSIAQNQFFRSNLALAQANNGFMDLSLIGNGSICRGTNHDNTIDNLDGMIESFEEDNINQIPNYNYSDASLNMYPKYYAKDEILKENFTFSDEERIQLTYDQHQYLSDVEAQISSVQYRVNPGTDDVQYLSAYQREIVGGIPDILWKTGDIAQLHDGDVTTEVIEVDKAAVVPGAGVLCSTDGAIYVGTEIRNSRMNTTGELEWDWNWELENVEIAFYLEGENILANPDVISLGQYVVFQMDIMARTADGNNYAIHIIDPVIEQVLLGFQTAINLAEIPGATVAGNVAFFYISLDSSYFVNLTDIHRYSSEFFGWNGTYGNPVITYRFLTLSLEDFLGYITAIHLGLNEFNCLGYSFRWNESLGELHRDSDVYLSEHFYDDDVLFSKNYFFSPLGYLNTGHAWDNRIELNENNSYLTLKTDFYKDFYESYVYIIVHIEYVKIRYYTYIPYTRSALEIDNDPTTRNLNYWQYNLNEIDQTLLYSAVGTLAYLNLSYLSLEYESWDVGWKYNVSVVFAFHINFEDFIFEDIISYSDNYGEYSYDLGLWYRDITIKWKEVRLEGIYIEELYIDGIVQDPDRTLLYNIDDNIQIWATTQTISKIWTEGDSYESITIEFYTKALESEDFTLIIIVSALGAGATIGIVSIYLIRRKRRS